MRVRLNQTVKGIVKGPDGKDKRVTWSKGQEFDGEIPEDVMALVKAKGPAVTIIGSAPLEVDELEKAKVEIEELKAQVEDLQSQIEAVASIKVDEELKPESESLICPVCGKEFDSQRGLTAHITRMHPDYGDEEDEAA